MSRKKPHILGIDDAPFNKKQPYEVPLVAVMMEGAILVEGVTIHSFDVDGENVTGFLADWIRKMRWFETLQGVVFGGITIAGLGIIDLRELSKLLNLPVIAVNRKPTVDDELINALRSGGYENRISIVEQTPQSIKVKEGVFISFAGTDVHEARNLVTNSLQKALVPEAVRIAHLIGAALVNGESKGRV